MSKVSTTQTGNLTQDHIFGRPGVSLMIIMIITKHAIIHHTHVHLRFVFFGFTFPSSIFHHFSLCSHFFFCRIENKIHRRTLEWISFSRRAITAQIHNDVLINLHVRPFRFFHFFSSLCAARFRFHFFDVFFSLFLFVLTANVLLVHSQFFFCFFPMINHALKL